jgi:DNA polymerase-3 subunit gamma/tau
MSHLVIARKWRPKVFSEVIGQDHAVRALTNAVTSGRVGHAYIFSGPRGVGKTTIARILAKCLNCEKGPVAVPCDECESCKGITMGSSVDVFEIDGASNTGVDNIRELKESVRYAPSAARHKIYIIDEVHMLSNAAFNALLKTLEEPPPHVIFIFATTEAHKIPLTIQSRCQRFDFKRIPLNQILTHLQAITDKEGVGADSDALYMIAREADGSLRDGQSLLEQVLAFAGEKIAAEDVAEVLGLMDRSLLLDLTRAILEKKGGDCLNIVEKIHDFGYDLKKVLAELIEAIRDLTVIRVLADKGDAVAGGGQEVKFLELSDSEHKLLSELSKTVTPDTLQMLFAILSRGYEDLSRSSSLRFSLEMTLMKAAHLEDIRPLSELIAKLDSIKGKISSLGSSGGGSEGAESADVSSPKPRQAVKTEPRPKKEVSTHKAASGDIEKQEAEPSVKADVLDVADKPDEKTEAGEVTAAALDNNKDTPRTCEGLLDYIAQRNKRLFDFLKSAIVSLEGSNCKITIDARQASFLDARRKTIEDICGEYLNGSVRLTIVKSGHGASVEEDAGPRQTESGQTESGQTESGQTESGQAESGQAESRPVSVAVGANSAGAAQDDTVIDAMRILGGRVIEDRRMS